MAPAIYVFVIMAVLMFGFFVACYYWGYETGTVDTRRRWAEDQQAHNQTVEKLVADQAEKNRWRTDRLERLRQCVDELEGF